MSENQCPKCGASISENKQYCPHRGARLSLAIEAPIIIEEKQELSPKTKKRLKIAGIAAAAFAVIGTTIGLLTPLVFVPSAQISEVKKGNIFSFNEIGDSYSVRANLSLEKYFSEYLPSKITIPNEYKGLPVTEIESVGFYSYSLSLSLKSITIPNSVTMIGEGAFSFLDLSSIIIPNSVTEIGYMAFYECEIERAFYAGSEDEWYSIMVGSENDGLYNRYYYSEEKPTESGIYWHYVDGVPTIWDN